MKKIIELIYQRYKLFVAIFIILVTLIISYLIYINRNSDVKAVDNIIIEQDEKVESSIEIPEIKNIKVDVKGLVINPGVYELQEGSRVIDAINASGGLLDNADTNSLNLSKKLKDENVIIVYSTEKIEPEVVIEYVYEECHCKEFNDACVNNNDIVNFQENKENNNPKNEESIIPDSNIKISINKASLEELQTLNGVGESKALAIIKYREENGEFKEIEDIMNVSGIGESLFAKIKESITI